MSSIHFIKTELAAALARGVRQCVVVGSRPLLARSIQEFSGPKLAGVYGG